MAFNFHAVATGEKVVCVCVCVCEREREREKKRKMLCMYVYVCSMYAVFSLHRLDYLTI